MWKKGSTREIDGKTYMGHFTVRGWVADCRVILVNVEYHETSGMAQLQYLRVAGPA